MNLTDLIHEGRVANAPVRALRRRDHIRLARVLRARRAPATARS